jgi:hypothetical protein
LNKFNARPPLERCLACEAVAVGTPGGEPLWHACDDLASLFLSFVWPKHGATGGSREWPQRDFCTAITGRNGKSIFTNLESSQTLGNSREPPVFTFFGLIRDTPENRLVRRHALKRLPSRVPTACRPRKRGNAPREEKGPLPRPFYKLYSADYWLSAISKLHRRLGQTT